MKPRIGRKVHHAGRGSPPDFQKGTKAILNFKVQVLPDEGTETDADSESRSPDSGSPTELKVIEDSRKKYPAGYGAPLELVFGKKFQIPVWEECLKTMLIDEICSFDVPAADLTNYPMVSKKLRDIGKQRDFPKLCDEDAGGHCHSSCFGLSAQMGTGYPDLDELMKQPKPLRFTFHLLKVFMPEEYEKDSWQLEATERLESVTELREKGNSSFKQGDFEAAMEIYEEALRRLDTLVIREKPGEPEWKELDDGKVPLYLNLAQCQLKSGLAYQAVESCSNALSRHQNNEKGLFRRAKALMAVWNLEDARKDLEALRSLNPKLEGVVSKELEVLENLKKEKEGGERNLYHGMFRS